MTRSRIVPKRWLSGPERFSSRHSPSVGSPGGSSEKRCRAPASAAERAESRKPASTTHVRSPGSCSMIPGSEALCKAGLLERMGTVGAWHLAAQARRREDLAGVRETARIEGTPQAGHDREILLTE